jgi:hypothetical protein
VISNFGFGLEIVEPDEVMSTAEPTKADPSPIEITNTQSDTTAAKIVVCWTDGYQEEIGVRSIYGVRQGIDVIVLVLANGGLRRLPTCNIRWIQEMSSDVAAESK